MIDAAKIAEVAQAIAGAEADAAQAQVRLTDAKTAYEAAATKLATLRRELTAAVQGQVLQTPSTLPSDAIPWDDETPVHTMQMRPGIVRITPGSAPQLVVDTPDALPAAPKNRIVRR